MFLYIQNNYLALRFAILIKSALIFRDFVLSLILHYVVTI